ncbi:Pre-mRNA cleavage complex II protein Clp1-domain-containing protein [Lasiosphaeria miniovina]|uniref:Polynucleotide 5'-hydroxyl-kinase GRC3 n=1 Tax=Lasiosphaeria miniovina TaxID=1954250 RepID=A0AA40ATK5_9PEZI|nr:Pre-mRNA cleavage complex II protein Clp1-domain-containing protein [Lasiosphaeria miniovina]KAK0721706.1 Pre-mRNA cleavage complex II protein Clp1-domain-containing protein [Lasiosphaeria miniovina]
MSIPGLGQLLPQPTTSTTRIVALKRLSEWRFDASRSSSTGVKVRLISGTAERDGTELALNKTYTFVRTKSKILTWSGCTLEISGESQDYVTDFPVAEDSPMVSYLNLHFELQAQRKAAANATRRNRPGPRVMVCGPQNSGKTSLVRMLAALSTKMGGQPLVANLDPGEGLLSLPGTVSAAVFGNVMDIEEPAGGFGVGSTPSSGPSAVPVKLPIVYYFGREKVQDDVALWKDLTSKLASSVRAKFSEDDEVRSAGLVLDTPVATTNQSDIDSLVHAAREFAVNIVVVLGSARIESTLQQILGQEKTSSGEPISVIMLDQSEGVAARDNDFVKSIREASIKEYFFGDSKRTLSPSTQSVSFDDVAIFKTPDEEGYETPPVGQVLEPAEITAGMSHWTLAVMDASVNDPPETIRQAPVIGFIAVADVDEDRRRLKILSPVTSRLGNKPLVWGRWPEPYINLLG